MRVGMVTACYKPVINGVTRMVALYKEHLEAEGHEVTVFTLGDAEPAGDEPGVVRAPGIALGDTGYYFSLRYPSDVQTQLRQMDILHCHHLFMSVEFAHRYSRCPIVYTNHTRYDLYTGAHIGLPQTTADAMMRQLWPRFTDFCDVVVTPSETVRQILHRFGVSRPMEVIENGIDLRPFREADPAQIRPRHGIAADATVVIYVGRLSPEKSLDRLLGQFAIAREQAPGLHLLLLGDGPLRAELLALARALDIADVVHFPGAVPYELVPRYLAAADLFASASESEVHPLTVIEAMAAGLPVVGVTSPGMEDSVRPDRTGLLTRHPEGGLAAALVALALDPARRQRLAFAARMESERFDIRHTIRKSLDLYVRLRQSRPDRARRDENGSWFRTWSEGWEPVIEPLTRVLKARGEPGAVARNLRVYREARDASRRRRRRAGQGEDRPELLNVPRPSWRDETRD